MTDFLDVKRKEIDERLKELRPMVDEFHRLEQAAAALSGVRAGTRSANGRRASAATARRRGRGRTGTGRRGRPRGSGTRARQALELVRSRPGITIPELADQMSIKQNYLYRVMPTLQQEGQVTKQGRGWHPVKSS